MLVPHLNYHLILYPPLLGAILLATIPIKFLHALTYNVALLLKEAAECPFESPRPTLVTLSYSPELLSSALRFMIHSSLNGKAPTMIFCCSSREPALADGIRRKQGHCQVRPLLPFPFGLLRMFFP